MVYGIQGDNMPGKRQHTPRGQAGSRMVQNRSRDDNKRAFLATIVHRNLELFMQIATDDTAGGGLARGRWLAVGRAHRAETE